jgi:uncharacterized protein
MSQLDPIQPAQRIEPIDVLRGLALFGVLLINLVMEFRVSIFEQFLPGHGAKDPLDHALQTFLTLAVELKAFALFSLLFGIGLAIQFDRLAANAQRTRLLIRRLFVLLAIGIVHLFLIWNGDILTHYAFAGFIVLPLLFGPSWLLPAAGLCFLSLYFVLPQASPLPAVPPVQWILQHVDEARRVYASGGFLEILQFRIREVPAIVPLHMFIFPRTLAMFCFGAALWRSGLLMLSAPSTTLLRTGAVGLIPAGAMLTLAAAQPDWLGIKSAGSSQFAIESLGSVTLAFGYGAAILAAANQQTGRRLLAWAAPVGRMAFTCYLTQSVLMGFIFYGYGLGLFGRMGVAPALLLAIAIYAVQVAISQWWLRVFYYGPVEWLWRRVMYGLPQPMRRRSDASARPQVA